MNRQHYKKISQNKITAQRGVNFIEQIVLEMGHAWHQTNEGLDAGIDGIIEIRNPETEEATNSIIQVQVKSTIKEWISETSEHFIYRCKPQDINYWINGNTPIILIVVSPNIKEAYWVNIKQYFTDSKRIKENKVIFDKATQAFNASVNLALLRIAVSRDVGPYLPATEHNETLYTNLLEVKSFPPIIYSASTDCRNREDIFEWENENKINLPSGWLLTEKMLRCVHDLREGPWARICDRGSVEQFDISEWSDSDDPDVQREFVRLMNQALQHDMSLRGLWHSNKEQCFFFPARMDDNKKPKPRQYRYKSLLKWTSRDVVMEHKSPKTNNTIYYRHSAIRCTFLRINRKWYLAIIPHYIYSIDGKNMYPYSEEMLSGIKRLELQEAVLGQTIMWKYKLTQTRTMTFFDDNKHSEPLIVFNDLLQAQCERGIPDKNWLKNDVIIESEEDGEGLF